MDGGQWFMDGRKKILGWLVNHFEVRRVMAADYVGDTYTDRNIIIQGRGMCRGAECVGLYGLANIFL